MMQHPDLCQWPGCKARRSLLHSYCAWHWYYRPPLFRPETEQCYTKTMNENNTTRNFWYMLALMTWLLLLFCVGLYKYDQSHNKSTQAYNSIKNELRMVQANETALQAQNKALSAKNDVLTATNTQLLQQKSQFCTELSKAKIAEPLCSQ